jgi:D-alanyl-D-alanine-carboxypeptidase/D-alanyl-D-alanine-endopeptidase
MTSSVILNQTMLFKLLPAAALLLALATPAQQLPPLPTADPLGAQLFAATGNTGMVLVLVRDNDVFMQSYGQTAPHSGQRPGPTSLIRLCSLSKILATDLLVKLAQDGTVHLTDPLQRFAPAGVHVPTQTIHGPALRPITLGDLATHTAGLPREIAYPAADGAHFTFPDHAFRWQWLPTYRLRTSPGVAAHYSNIGFDLLGDALETAAGKPYAQLFAERTAIPLGLHDTTLTPTPEQCSRLLQGAKNEGPCTDTQAAAGSGGMYSTPEDMARFLKYLLGLPGVPIHQNPAALAVYILPDQLKWMQGLDHAGPPTGLGLGWVRLGQPEDPGMIMEKTGGGAGFTTYIALNPAHHIGLFLAATEARSPTHVNLFKEANNLLTVLAGLPPLPPEPVPSLPITPATPVRAIARSSNRPHPQSRPASIRRKRRTTQ